MVEHKVNRSKLTKRIVEASVSDTSKRKLIWDTDVVGFCVRIYPTGRKTYFFQYRNAYKKTKFVKIGVHGNITAEQAREKATQLALKVSGGEDPSIKTPHKLEFTIMGDLAEKYLKLHAENEKRPKSVKEDKYMLRNYILKEFGIRKVDTITFEDIQTLHVSLNKKRILANRILALLHKMFNLAIQWKWCKDNPVSGIKKYQETKRTRWLQEDEMVRFLNALDIYPNQTIADIVRLLILTGARKHEVLGATWDQFDLDKGIWTKRAHTTKQKKMEHSPLSPPATAILKKIEKEKRDSLFLFPGNIKGKPLQDIKKSWQPSVN